MSDVGLKTLNPRKRGAKRSFSPEKEAVLLDLYNFEPPLSIDAIARQFKVCRKTIYNTLNRLKAQGLIHEKARATPSVTPAEEPTL